jgi:hypothetical protein
MKGGILSDTGKSAKQIAIDAAKSMAREPLEILKNAGETLAPSSNIPKTESEVGGSASVALDPKKEEEGKKKDMRTVQALENEMKDISKNEVIDNIQKKIALGEPIYFENYPELPPEQLEILKRQKEETDARRKYEAKMSTRSVIESGSKRGRRFGTNKKQVSERESTRTENPTPPSG